MNWDKVKGIVAIVAIILGVGGVVYGQGLSSSRLGADIESLSRALTELKTAHAITRERVNTNMVELRGIVVRLEGVTNRLEKFNEK